MKRSIFIAALAAIVLGVGSLFAQPASAAGTNNFRITKYDIQYELGRDEKGHSTLKTTETITANFPQQDENHGLERAIPSSYNGHTTSLKVQSVTDEKGTKLAYSSKSDGNDLTIMRIGDADTYVHGLHTYKITYTQKDVTRFYKDTGRDEWYWDTNGVEWQVPIDSLSVTMRLDDSVEAAMAVAPSCYAGKQGSTKPCLLTQFDGGYTVQTSNLRAYENVTVAFGFKQGTFEAYVTPWWMALFAVWVGLQFIAMPVAVVLMIIFSVLYVRRSNRTKELGSYPAEYIPPKEASVTISASIKGNALYTFTAQLIDLAVRHYISIVETSPKSGWKPAEYDIVVESEVSTLRPEEREILVDMFNKTPSVGDRIAFSSLKNNQAYARRLSDNYTKASKLLTDTYKLREKSPEQGKFFKTWGKVLMLCTPVFSSFLLAGFVVWILGYTLRPLTDKGLALRRYLLGLERYIKASEVERLSFLQGPDTAEKVGYAVDAANPGQLVKLYERVLPYAVLFGYEKEWGKRLSDLYQETQDVPTWYAGTTAFNAAAFSTALHSFSQSASYSAGGSSSSSGGSGGGGSSGGGGGGGGGGGW